jgi:hypothetical protein
MSVDVENAWLFGRRQNNSIRKGAATKWVSEWNVRGAEVQQEEREAGELHRGAHAA